MKIKAKINFRDKESEKMYEKGKIYDLDKQKADRILKSPYSVAEEVKKERGENQDTKCE